MAPRVYSSGPMFWKRRRKLTAEEGDQLVLEQLESLGADLSQPREVRHYLYFPAETAASEVADALATEGFTIEKDRGADGRSWLVLAIQTMVPTPESIAALRTRLTAVADERGGEYDGWEAAAEP